LSGGVIYHEGTKSTKESDNEMLNGENVKIHLRVLRALVMTVPVAAQINVQRLRSLAAPARMPDNNKHPRMQNGERTTSKA
jgi:cobalamin biosynthesis protein CbiG